MSATMVESFVLGKDPYPAWFKSISEEHKVHYIIDDTGKVLRVIINNPKETVTAQAGDTLVYFQGSIVVVPKDAAEKYM